MLELEYLTDKSGQLKAVVVPLSCGNDYSWKKALP
jgi:hypothetical protein